MIFTLNYGRSPAKRTINSEQCSSFWVSLKVLHYDVKVDASKSHNRSRETAALAAVQNTGCIRESRPGTSGWQPFETCAADGAPDYSMKDKERDTAI